MYIVNRPFLYTNATGENVMSVVGSEIPEAEGFPTLRALLNLGWILKKDSLAPATAATSSTRLDAAVIPTNIKPRRRSRGAPLDNN